MSIGYYQETGTSTIISPHSTWFIYVREGRAGWIGEYLSSSILFTSLFHSSKPSKCILYYCKHLLNLLASKIWCHGQQAREDAHRIRELVATPSSNRLQDGFDGPSPTQKGKK